MNNYLWKNIDSAPKDGTVILAFGNGIGDGKGVPIIWDSDAKRNPMWKIIYWSEGWYDKEVDLGEGLYKKEKALSYAYWAPDPHQFFPTHWMPLPECPKE